MTDQLEQEERDLEDRFNRGELSVAEYNKQMRDLQRAYQDSRREEAQEAYDRVMERDEW